MFREKRVLRQLKCDSFNFRQFQYLSQVRHVVVAFLQKTKIYPGYSSVDFRSTDDNMS